MKNYYKPLGSDDYKPKRKKLTKTDTGVFVDKDGFAGLDLFAFSYNPERDLFIINSRQTGISFELNVNSVSEFLSRVTDVDFGGF